MRASVTLLLIVAAASMATFSEAGLGWGKALPTSPRAQASKTPSWFILATAYAALFHGVGPNLKQEPSLNTGP